MKQKIILTNDEISHYNEYKKKIRSARSRSEVLIYQGKAKSILETGKLRYLKKLESGKPLMKHQTP